MSNILVCYSDLIPTVNLVADIMKRYSAEYGCKLIFCEAVQVDRATLEWADTLLLIRPYDWVLSRIACSAKAAQRKIIVYLDDDLLHLPNLTGGGIQDVISKVLKRKNQRALRKCLKVCDVLWGSSPVLLKKYQQYLLLGRCELTDVTADISRMVEPRVREGNTKFLFAGGRDHAELLNEYVIPALNQLAEEGETFSFLTIGVDRELLNNCNFELKCISWINDYEEYRRIVMEQRYDVGIAAIKQEEFYKCKYYNKYIEYCLLGIVGIYTDCEPYSLVVKDKINGLLAKPSVEEWKNALRYAIRHEKECKECVIEAQKDVREKFAESRIINDMAKKMPELGEKVQNPKRVIYHPSIIWARMRHLGVKLLRIYEKHKL